MAIDITSISRIESAHFKVALDTDELQMLEPYIPENLLYEFNHLGQRGDKIDFPEFSLGTLFTAYDKAKQDLKNISITKVERGFHVRNSRKRKNATTKSQSRKLNVFFTLRT